jgi:SAM-dependent methyltransferase
MAYQQPDTRVVGIDIGETMIRYAQEMTRVQRLNNAHLQVTDATKPLAFPDHSFDLVNARGLSGFMPREVWPGAVRAFVRVTRPGGIIRLTEPDSLGSSNSFALEKYVSLFTRAYFVTGRSFSPFPQAQHFGLTFMLGSFLQSAGCRDIQQKACVVDFSAEARAYLSNYENYKVGFKLLQPFLIQAGVAT